MSRLLDPVRKVTPPKHIYLQNEGDGADPETWEGASWCQDRIEESDVQYVRADLVYPIPEQLRTAIAWLDEIRSRNEHGPDGPAEREWAKAGYPDRFGFAEFVSGKVAEMLRPALPHSPDELREAFRKVLYTYWHKTTNAVLDEMMGLLHTPAPQAKDTAS